MGIYFTSDLHLNHDREFIYKARGYDSIKEHDETIIKNWNEMISDDDLVFILGDVIMGQDLKYGLSLLSRLNGNKRIIRGNHDTNHKVEGYIAESLANPKSSIQFTGLESMTFKYGKKTFYLSHYPALVENKEVKKKIWEKVINLHGHTHQKEKFDFSLYQNYCVGLDAHNNRPVSIETIINDIENRARETKR